MRESMRRLDASNHRRAIFTIRADYNGHIGGNDITHCKLPDVATSYERETTGPISTRLAHIEFQTRVNRTTI